jgi:hypothetical protein
LQTCAPVTEDPGHAQTICSPGTQLDDPPLVVSPPLHAQKLRVANAAIKPRRDNFFMVLS